MESQKSKINTDGGAFIEGDMSAGRDAIGRDQINTHSDTTINHNYFTNWSIAITLLLSVLISLAIYSIIPKLPTTQTTTQTPSLYFSYKVLVQDEASHPLEQAQVTLYIGGDLVLPIERTDVTGLAVFSIPLAQRNGAARLLVERVNYTAYIREISLLEGTLPNRVVMKLAE